jgi:hypothetical protein
MKRRERLERNQNNCSLRECLQGGFFLKKKATLRACFRDTSILVLLPEQEIEFVHKTADRTVVVDFFVERLRTIFAEVADPGFLFNSKCLLFVLFFAANNKTGVKIANDLLRDIAR